MKQVRTYGRMELAQTYFPAISPRAAWKKLKSLLLDNPSTAPFARLTRRNGKHIAGQTDKDKS